MKLYHFLKQLYYFKCMRKKLYAYMRSCHKCQIMNLQKPKFLDLHQDIAQTPQEHISIDPLEPYNTTSQGNMHVLTVVCNLTSYLMTTLIKDKKTTSVANHLFADIMLKFGFPRILHLDNWCRIQIQTHGKPLTTIRYKENFHFSLSTASKWKIRICVLTQVY